MVECMLGNTFASPSGDKLAATGLPAEVLPSANSEILERTESQLQALFRQINVDWFESKLPLCRLRWNSRLRVAAGRFIPVRRKDPPSFALIEVASYLLEEKDARKWVVDTLSHEMIHYWLWFVRKPHGHTPEFHEKMRQMSVSRYNLVPRQRAHKYIYACPACQKRFLARRRLSRMACADCCKKFAKGRFNAKFELFLFEEIVSKPTKRERSYD